MWRGIKTGLKYKHQAAFIHLRKCIIDDILVLEDEQMPISEAKKKANRAYNERTYDRLYVFVEKRQKES